MATDEGRGEGGHGPRRALVIGASSQVGWFVLPRLLARGYLVDALSRRPPLDVYPDLDDLGWVTPDAIGGGYSHLVSAGPLALCLELARDMDDLRAIVATSTSSVLSKVDSPSDAEREEVEAIREAEEGLRALARERDLPLLLLRPTLVYGCGRDRNLTVLANFIRRFGFLPLSTRAGGLRQPVHADDVAQALVAGLEPRDARELVTPLCGGDAIDYRTMVRRLFTALDREPRLLALPPGLLAGGMRVAGWFGLGRVGTPEMVRRQAVNLVFDDAEARRVLGVDPRRFHPEAEDFRSPAPATLERLRNRH